MKITEVLKQSSKTPVLIAYINKDTGLLASILDRANRQENEVLLNELVNSGKHLKDKDKIDEVQKQISQLKKQVSSITPYEFELSEPTFDVISLALSSVYTEGGKIDTMSSGKVVFDACYLGNQGTLEEIQKLTTLYLSLCSKCYHSIVDIADIEYKKK